MLGLGPDVIGEALTLLASPTVFVMLLLGAIVGIVFGAIPGIAGPVAMATVIPLLYGVQPITAILFLSAIYTGSISGGSITSVLLKMPGQPGSEPTALEAFPLVRRGDADIALGLVLYSSVVGTFLTSLLFVLLIGPAGALAGFMGPADRAAVILAAVMLIGGLRSGSALRGIGAGLFGLMLGTFAPTQTGLIRSPFPGIALLHDGLPLLPTVLGLIALSELVGFVGREYLTEEGSAARRPRLVEILRQFRLWWRYRIHALAGTIMGFLIGVMPAAGASVAALFAHGQVRAWTSKREDSGLASLVAAESADNASQGGATLVMLVLGIPGSGGTAVLLIGFLAFGLAPGPLFVQDNLPFLYAIAIGNLALALVLVPLVGMFMSGLASVVRFELRYLAPALVVISSVGIFSLRSSVLDVVLLWTFAYLGYVLKRHDFPPIAVLLGFILGPIIDAEMFRIQAIYRGRIAELLTRPVVIASAVLTVLILARPVLEFVRRDNGRDAQGGDRQREQRRRDDQD